jgi:hypothetical protein
VARLLDSVTSSYRVYDVTSLWYTVKACKLSVISYVVLIFVLSERRQPGSILIFYLTHLTHAVV